MKIRIKKYSIMLYRKKNSHEFYFGIGDEKGYFFKRFFRFQIAGGANTLIILNYFEDKNKNTRSYISKRIGLYFDIDILTIRLGIYWRPINYYSTKTKKTNEYLR